MKDSIIVFFKRYRQYHSGGIADENVNPAGQGTRLVHEGTQLRLVSYITGPSQNLCASCAKFISRPVQSRPRSGTDRERCPFTSKSQGHSFA